ncbi:MAG: BatA domain-containing protein [Vicinamibacterales bacterium]
MSFLAPLFFAAFAALAVPVLIHLIQREKKQIVYFPSLMFLEKIPYRSVQRRRIHNWALLLLRMAAIVLIVTAFARPFFNQATIASAAATGSREVVILLDRSYSMGYGDRWQRAQAEARKAIDALRAGDRASLVFFARGAEVDARSTDDRARLRLSVERATVGSGSTRYGPALKVAQSILEQSTRTRRDAILISDFQKSGWDGPQDVRFPLGATLTAVPVTDPTTANVTVLSAAFQREEQSGQQRVTVTAGLQNRSDKPAPALDVALDIDGRQVQAQQVSLGANASGSVTFQPLVLPAPNSRGSIRIANDSLARDNAFYFTISPGRPVSVLIVERSGAGRDVSFYLRGALGIGREPAFRADVKSIDQFTAADLAERTVVILNDVPLGGGLPDRLKGFVERGGGLLVVVGDRSTWPDGLTIMPGALNPSVDRGLGRAGSIGSVDFSHPVFELFRAPRSGGFAGTRVFRYRALDVAAPARVLARFDDGGVALAEKDSGQGRVLVWTGTLDNLWSDLVLKPVFLPFVHQVMTYLARYETPTPWLTVGQVFAERRSGKDRLALTPTGQRIPVSGTTRAAPASQASGTNPPPGAPGPSPGEVWVELNEQGFYEIRDTSGGDATAVSVAVNVDTTESDLMPLDPQELVAAVTGRARASDPQAAAEAAELRPADLERRQAIWWYLLVAGVLLLAGETWLSNRLSRAAA